MVTAGECKQGMDIAYDGTWGYYPVVVSLANAGEILSLINRSSRTKGADVEIDRAIGFVAKAAFARSWSAAIKTSRRPAKARPGAHSATVGFLPEN